MKALDASALLAFLMAEEGHEVVAAALGDACMTTVNLSEVLSRFARDGHDPGVVAARLARLRIEWVAFDEQLGLNAARLTPATRPAGLSLGDRACLALALSRGVPALTADRAWLTVNTGAAVELIR